MHVNLANNTGVGTKATHRPGPQVSRLIPPQRAMRPGQPGTEQVLTTRVGLQLPVVFTFEEWQRAGRQLAGVVDSSSWWLGDWLAYGKDHYGDRYQQGIQAAGLRYQTLRNYAWIARRFEMGRRRAKLTFQHHAEVASLPVEEQDLWLTRAEEFKWTTKQLRSALREARDGVETLRERPAPRRQLAVPAERFDCWLKAADRLGTDLDEWVLATLDSAAERVFEALGPAEPEPAALEAAEPAADIDRRMDELIDEVRAEAAAEAAADRRLYRSL
ncbi:LmbU family transcriptional regulator [Streptomyces venezuelae]|uniref:LmbU family transcriptional regulator n=1 Tax=Streptomyces venezuelae TaxID=54571 RepID=UPI001CC267CF|nr:LmbU family transcriptional regulator [Streptomyces venezuelae]